ncbi:uncharacterized protein LOC114517791 isoform X2 [Dendronephthya gigantea]|uniref:uncharacterized protein LOC114517791 isoform X2 n=1 Tax=Dendronephthya gigantea TaxID=151771 RepID=UPI00106D1681|nr:uncharacterized protein LOC114517791 isoform X2 [Dendronephthya gigantea]
MCSGKILESYFLSGLIVTLLCFASGTSPPIVLPDRTIHGTQRDRFEIHNLTDIAGGNWKAVHIPDKDISAMLKIANAKDGKTVSMDIQHKVTSSLDDENSGDELPVEVHGRVHAFQHVMRNKTKNMTVGRLIIASENEHRGDEVGSLHPTKPSVMKLRGYMKEEGPKNREMIHRKNPMKPSLIVAKVSEDDDDDSEDLPLRKLPTPIVASLRKTRTRIKPGAMRSDILAGIIHPAKNRELFVTSSKTASKSPKKSNVSQGELANKNTAATSPGRDDPMVLEKIKALLLKSSSTPKPTIVSSKAPTKSESERESSAVVLRHSKPGNQNNVPASKPNNIPPATQKYKTFPTLKPNQDGLFLPSKFARPTDAFSNHASVLNRISEPKRDALLIGIIKALLARDRGKPSSTSPMMNGAALGMPHYNRQAILQGLQNLQMSKTIAPAESGATVPGEDLGTGNPPMPGKNLDETYQKEREQEVKEELGRANEEVLEEKKMRQEESQILANYDHFQNPESRANWGNVAGRNPVNSQTPDGQTLSMLGTQQLDMLADNPSTTR